LGDSLASANGQSSNGAPRLGQLGSGTYGLDDVDDLLNARFAGSGTASTNDASVGFNIEPSANGILGWQGRLPAQPSTVRAGDYGGSMERIARAQLGANASQRAINNYVGQLIELNGIQNPRAVGGDLDIVLPGADTPSATRGLRVYAKDIDFGERATAAAAQAATNTYSGAGAGRGAVNFSLDDYNSWLTAGNEQHLAARGAEVKASWQAYDNKVAAAKISIGIEQAVGLLMAKQPNSREDWAARNDTFADLTIAHLSTTESAGLKPDPMLLTTMGLQRSIANYKLNGDMPPLLASAFAAGTFLGMENASLTGPAATQAAVTRSTNATVASAAQAIGTLSQDRFSQLVGEFTELSSARSYSAWKSGLLNGGVHADDIAEIVHQGSLKKGENLWGDNWKRYYEEISNTKYPGSPSHAHHKAEKEGVSVEAAYNRKIVEEVGLSVRLSKENLTWAPNVAGQHGSVPQGELLNRLQAVRGDKAGVIRVLREWDEVVKGR